MRASCGSLRGMLYNACDYPPGNAKKYGLNFQFVSFHRPFRRSPCPLSIKTKASVDRRKLLFYMVNLALLLCSSLFSVVLIKENELVIKHVQRDLAVLINLAGQYLFG